MALSYEQGNRQKLCYRAGLESDLVRPPGTSQTLVDGSGYLFLHNLALSIVPVPVSLVCLQPERLGLSLGCPPWITKLCPGRAVVVLESRLAREPLHCYSCPWDCRRRCWSVIAGVSGLDDTRFVLLLSSSLVSSGSQCTLSKLSLDDCITALTFTQHWRRFVGRYLARSDQLIRVAVEEEFALRNGRRGCSTRCVSSQHQQVYKSTSSFPKS